MVDWKFIDLIPYQKVPKASYTQVLYWFLNSCIFHHDGLHEHDAISPVKNFGGVSLIDFSTHACVILFGSNAWASGMIKDYIYVGNVWQKAWDNCVGTYVRSTYLAEGMRLLLLLIPISGYLFKVTCTAKDFCVAYLLFNNHDEAA